MKRIILLSQPLLKKRFGSAGLSALIAAASPLATAQLVRSSAKTAIGLRADLQAALKAHPSAAILLLGGPDTLPFFMLPNPTKDGDPGVQSDNPYAVRGKSLALTDVFLTPFPMGRIPEHPGDVVGTFIARIVRLCKVSPAARTASASYALTTVSWLSTSKLIAKKLGFKAPDKSPSRQPPDFASSTKVPLGATSHYHFNLHGDDLTAPWYGENAAVTKQPDAFDPSSVIHLAKRAKTADVLVVSQACFGAYLENRRGLRTPAQAICLQFLESGAAGFVGSTTIAYGMPTGLQCSDITVVEFFKAVFAGASLGEALSAARTAVARSAKSPPAGAVLKTLLQFVLYGDPAAFWSPAADLAPKAFEHTDALDLGEYDAWVEQEPEQKQPLPKGLLPKGPGKMANASGAPGWSTYKRFAAQKPSAGTLAAKGARGPERTLLIGIEQLGADVLSPIARFREVIEYGAERFDVQSTGGIAVTSLLEQSQRSLLSSIGASAVAAVVGAGAALARRSAKKKVATTAKAAKKKVAKKKVATAKAAKAPRKAARPAGARRARSQRAKSAK